MVPLELVREELGKVLQSRTFANTDSLRRFLRFVVEASICGRTAQLKEYVIGSEALGRGPTFDPRTDSVVRVEARNLRLRLERYYADEGKNDVVIIDLPKGSYAPQFQQRRPKSILGGIFRSTSMRIAAASLLVALGVAVSIVRSRRPPDLSLALLPFDFLSDGADLQYLADGLAEELRLALSRTPGLRIAGRISTARFDPKHLDLPAVRGALQVAWLLEGSVRKVETRLRITTHLVRTRDGEIVWADGYEVEAGDLPRTEGRIVAAVVAAIRPAAQVQPPAVAPVPVSAEAHDAYLRGRYLRRQMSADGIARSVGFFEDAIRRDSHYAPAYAALADAYAMMGFHGLAAPDEMAPKAREAARHALALDPQNAQAHGALAWLAFTYDRNWKEAEAEFRRAVETDPNWPSVRQWFAFGLVAQARFDDAVAQSRTALELEPLSYLTGNDMSSVLYFARRYSESLRTARRGLELDPHASQPHVVIGACLAAMGNLGGAIAEFRQALDPEFSDEDLLGRLGYTYGRSGRRTEARQLLERLSGRKAGATASAFIQLGLGDKGRALALFSQACNRREGDTLFLRVEPMADSLRADPRFAALLKNAGL